MAESLFGKHILLLAPHPDDEVVAYAATIRRAQKEGATFYILYLSSGCVEPDLLWPWQRKNYEQRIIRRLEESQHAALRLNLKQLPSNIHRPTRHVWCNLDKVYQEIMVSLTAHAIDQIWTLAYEGGHPDHDGVNGICSLINERIPVLEFAAYNYAGRRQHAQSFPPSSRQSNETIIRLGAFAMREKAHLLDMYGSERSNLRTIGLEQECFRPLHHYDYTKPPHKGPLWYTRFQWVPIKHPKVNRTNPLDVCEAITDFRAARVYPQGD
ncbi:MAG: PIG-L family deacetylase [Alphaproteobacteria bacterium]|nr:PIG-L family deacetylase [Alphaproteobacteria bacterium]